MATDDEAEIEIDRERVPALVDPHFQRVYEAGPIPGISYAVLLSGEPIHQGSLGTLEVERHRPPGPRSAFRIASMTKSFTAATVLGLCDEGRLGLEQRVVELVPELGAGGADARTITVRHLLTMGAGFPTDDPWGDRQQDLPIAAFRELLRRGVSPVLPPGERFEYSNLGYALLGLVITAATGDPYESVVRARVLDPLGLHDTGFAVTDLATDEVATGYVKRTEGWQVEPIAAAGAFAPMGGLLSTTADLARWVRFLQLGEGSDGTDDVLSGTRRREMQRTQRLVSAVSASEAGDPPTLTGYGFGLFEDLRPWGRTVFHSGGYPGFGSHMRWHPASGLAIVALGSSSYAPMSTASLAALDDLVTTLRLPTSPRAVRAAGLEPARELVRAWLAADDPDGPEAAALRATWADNVERDLPWAERATVWQSLRDEWGALAEVPGSQRQDGCGTVSWELGPAGPGGTSGSGRLRVTVMVAPHDTRLVQSLTIRALGADQPRPASADLS